MDQWLSKVHDDAKLLVTEVEKKVKEVEKRLASYVASGKGISQKMEQQIIKVDKVLEMSKENAACINTQGEEIEGLKAEQRALKGTVDSVKSDTTSIHTKMDKMLEFLMAKNLSVEEGKGEGKEKDLKKAEGGVSGGNSQS